MISTAKRGAEHNLMVIVLSSLCETSAVMPKYLSYNYHKAQLVIIYVLLNTITTTSFTGHTR